MPIESVLVLTGVLSLFALFAVFLAWGDWQTRKFRG